MQEEIRNAVIELTAVYEAVGDETFFMAVEEFMNTHPTIKSDNTFLAWTILLLYKDYDPDRILEVSHETMINNYRATLQGKLG